jgi:hypothetical protein
MTTNDYREKYSKAITPYEKDDYESFKKVVDSMKSEHKFIFMLMLETCMYEIQSRKCCEYLISLMAPELTSEELVLCTISNNAMLKEIMDIKKLDLENMKKLVSQLKENNRKKFGSLYTDISDSAFNFSGTEQDFRKIDGWLEDIKLLLLR